MTYPNEHTGTFTGTAGVAYPLEVSEQYTTNRITFLSITSGVMTIRAKIRGSTRFEDVINGTLSLETRSTITIRGHDIEELEFTNSLTNPFTVEIFQSEPIKVTS